MMYFDQELKRNRSKTYSRKLLTGIKNPINVGVRSRFLGREGVVDGVGVAVKDA